jgi:hypothetical protein
VRRQQRVGSVLKHAVYRTGFSCPARWEVPHGY